jgi:phage terminase small subunit
MADSRGQGSKPLNPREARFVLEFGKDGNATRAYRAAGFKAKNDNVAAAAALKLKARPHVAAAIIAQQLELRDVAKIDQAWVLERYKHIVEKAYAADSDRIAALNSICKVLGLNAAERVKLEAKVSGKVINILKWGDE